MKTFTSIHFNNSIIFWFGYYPNNPNSLSAGFRERTDCCFYYFYLQLGKLAIGLHRDYEHA